MGNYHEHVFTYLYTKYQEDRLRVREIVLLDKLVRETEKAVNEMGQKLSGPGLEPKDRAKLYIDHTLLKSDLHRYKSEQRLRASQKKVWLANCTAWSKMLQKLETEVN